MTTTAVHPFTEAFSADPDHSSLQAQLRHMGVGTFRTGFDELEARLETGSDGPRLTGRVPVESIGIRRRLQFSEDGTVALDGLLTMRGVERPITATGTYLGPVEDIYGDRRAALDLRAEIDRRDWGMSFQAELPRGGDALSWTVELTAHLELVAG
jgi:polyisoprenoid-binding protein YceI